MNYYLLEKKIMKVIGYLIIFIHVVKMTPLKKQLKIKLKQQMKNAKQQMKNAKQLK
jgi:hypothetical protein